MEKNVAVIHKDFSKGCGIANRFVEDNVLIFCSITAMLKHSRDFGIEFDIIVIDFVTVQEKFIDIEEILLIAKNNSDKIVYLIPTPEQNIDKEKFELNCLKIFSLS